MMDLGTAPFIGKSTVRRVELLLRHFHELGLPLAVCADRKHLGRKVVTLKGYARRLGLAFPDYVPRPKKEKTEA